ncbi:MAG: glycosyltransferase family 4 protein [Desulfobacteraceae bacterium]|nr:glycosyltransferase family 4 protein [Desulfobacteraceae bacterium]
MKEKKIVIFESYYKAIGGNQRYIAYLFKYQNYSGYKPVLICPGQGILTDLVKAENGEIHILNAPQKLLQYGGSISRALLPKKLIIYMMLFIYNIRALTLLHRLKPSVLLCNNIRSLLMIGNAAKLCRIPVVWFVKGELDNSVLDRIGFKLAAKVIFLSKSLMHPCYKKIFKKYPDKFHHVRIGIELDAAQKAKTSEPVEVAPGFPRDRNTVSFACASYIRPKKGLESLIDAFSHIIRKGYKSRLYIIGDTADKDYVSSLANQARNNGSGEFVHFIGWTDNIHEVLEATDVYVLPSLTEGVSRSVVEAMSQGKPVIATNVGGIFELLQGGGLGLVVPPADTAALLEAMEKLVSDPLLREKMGQAARAEIFSNYSIQTHVQNLSKVFEELATKGRS